MSTTELINDPYLLLSTVAQSLTEAGVKITPQGVKWWISRGVGGVKLRGKKVGRRWFTKQSWLDEFFAARELRDDSDALTPAEQRRSDAARRAREKRTNRTLPPSNNGTNAKRGE